MNIANRAMQNFYKHTYKTLSLILNSILFKTSLLDVLTVLAMLILQKTMTHNR